ncbi:MAG: hypothetical protein EXQ52_08240 [Bryobacterales bacterium]|nr:hypothetical protein [Bryobacterales bacterium]
MTITRRQWMAAGLTVAAAARGQDINHEIRAAADKAPLRMQFAGGSAFDCRRWQQSFGARLNEMLGSYQPPAKWQTITESHVTLAGHERYSFLLRADGVRDLPVHLLVPTGGAAVKRPAIVALHGHGEYGYDSVAGVATTREQKAAIAAANYDYGVQLARRGYVVAIPCLTPFGRRLGDAKASKQDACGVTFVRMQLLGKLLIAENLRDALWSIELLAAQPNVDSARMGCVGLSYGGRMTMLTSAVSPRVQVAVISGALNIMQERVLGGSYGCGAQVIPGLLQYGDVPEIASLIAPRPCLWEVGNNDSLMVKDRIPNALERMRRAWGALDAAPNLDVDYFEGKHQWNGVKSYPLLASVLRPPEDK